MSYKNLIFLGAGLIVGAAGMWAVPQVLKCKAPAPKPAPKLDEAAARLPENDTTAFKALGIMCAEKAKLVVGFNEMQIGWLTDGFKQGLSGVPAPESFREDLGRAEKVYKQYAEKASEARKAKADENEKAAQAFIDALPDKADLQKTASGLYYKIEVPGDPAKKPTKTDRVKLNYTGSLTSGKVFDSNTTGKFEIPLTGVVKGFQEGLQLIGVGGKIKLYVPGKLGYKENPPPESGIAPGSMLIFDVELLGTEAMPNKASPKARNKPTGIPPNMPPEGMKVPPAPPSTKPPMMTPPQIPPELLKKHPMLPQDMKAPTAPENAPTAAATATSEAKPAATAETKTEASPNATTAETKPAEAAATIAAPAETKPATEAPATETK